MNVTMDQHSNARHSSPCPERCCLGEKRELTPKTRWTASTATSFLQTYPNGGLCGGEAIVISCGFRLLQEVVKTPGKIIAAHIQTRTDRFWVVLAYCYPSSARDDCEALARWLADHQDKFDQFFLFLAILNTAITPLA